MSETKRCPYCGEEILAVAKKCKHCGEWLAKEETTAKPVDVLQKKTDAEHKSTKTYQSSNSTLPKHSQVIYYVIGAVVLAAIIVIALVSNPSKTTKSDGFNEDDMVAVEETPIESYDNNNMAGSNQKFEDALREISGVADNAVKYSDGRYIWYNPTTPWGYSTILTVYDSQTGSSTDININKTPSSEDMMKVQAISEHNGKITVILEENRNSNGWVEGTYVWTIDCSNRNWKCIANGVAGAEIINGGSAVKITTATILNPDAPTFEQEYKETTKTINL